MIDQYSFSLVWNFNVRCWVIEFDIMFNFLQNVGTGKKLVFFDQYFQIVFAVFTTKYSDNMPYSLHDSCLNK